MNKNRVALLFLFAISAIYSAGCAPKENPEALPHTDPAKVEKGRKETIERVKNDPKIPAEAKAKALQYMGGGGDAPKPLGATTNAPK